MELLPPTCGTLHFILFELHEVPIGHLSSLLGSLQVVALLSKCVSYDTPPPRFGIVREFAGHMLCHIIQGVNKGITERWPQY